MRILVGLRGEVLFRFESVYVFVYLRYHLFVIG